MRSSAMAGVTCVDAPATLDSAKRSVLRDATPPSVPAPPLTSCLPRATLAPTFARAQVDAAESAPSSMRERRRMKNPAKMAASQSQQNASRRVSSRGRAAHRPGRRSSACNRRARSSRRTSANKRGVPVRRRRGSCRRAAFWVLATPRAHVGGAAVLATAAVAGRPLRPGLRRGAVAKGREAAAPCVCAGERRRRAHPQADQNRRRAAHAEKPSMRARRFRW